MATGRQLSFLCFRRLPVAQRRGHRRDEMWPQRRNDYKRFPRKRVPPRSHRSDGNQKVANTAPKKSPLVNTAGEGSSSRYYSHVDYQNYDEGCSFSLDRRGAVSLDRRNAVSQDRRGALSLNRRGTLSQDRRGALSRDRRGALSRDRRGALSLNRRGALSLNRRSALFLNRRSTLSLNRRGALTRNRRGALTRDRRGALTRDRRGALTRDRRGALSLDRRSALSLDRRSALSLDRRSALSLDRRSSLSLDQRSSLSLDRRSALSLDQRSALSLDRRSALSLDRRSDLTQDRKSALSLDGRSGPPHRGAESGNTWTREDHSARPKPDYRDMKDGARRKSSHSSDYVRGRSQKRDTPFLRESLVGQKDSPQSRSDSTVCNRGYSLERSKSYSSQQSQHRKSMPAGAAHKQNEGKPDRGEERPVQSLKTSRHTSSSSSAVPSSKVLDKPRGEERPVQSLKTSRHTSSSSSAVPSSKVLDKPRGKERPVQSLKTSRHTSSSSSAVPSSKVLDKPSQLTKEELPEAASKWAAVKLEKADEGALPEISEYESGSKAPLLMDQPEDPESSATHGKKLFQDILLTSRSKAIACKTKEIEQAYRQDCETFGMVVKMLIEKDPSLENHIQFSLRRNLQAIGERCIQELKHFIADYDASTQGSSRRDFGGPC